jgi:hypothetical protein
MPHGAFRRVLLIPGYAVKLPRLRTVFHGLRCNRWEREVWRVWRPIFGWPNLCPVLLADPLGLFVVMPRADQPVTFAEVVEATPDCYPEPTNETKVEDFGRVDGRVVALDYGLPWADAIVEARARWDKLSKR